MPRTVRMLPFSLLRSGWWNMAVSGNYRMSDKTLGITHDRSRGKNKYCLVQCPSHEEDLRMRLPARPWVDIPARMAARSRQCHPMCDSPGRKEFRTPPGHATTSALVTLFLSNISRTLGDRERVVWITPRREAHATYTGQVCCHLRPTPPRHLRISDGQDWQAAWTPHPRRTLASWTATSRVNQGELYAASAGEVKRDETKQGVPAVARLTWLSYSCAWHPAMLVTSVLVGGHSRRG